MPVNTFTRARPTRDSPAFAYSTRMIFYGVDAILPLIEHADLPTDEVGDRELQDAMSAALWFLEQAAAPPGVKLAPSGRLGRAFIQAGEERFRWTRLHEIDAKPQTQDDVPPLVELRTLLTRTRLIRTYKKHLVATKAGQQLLDSDADELRSGATAIWRNVCNRDGFDDELISLILVTLLDAGPSGMLRTDLVEQVGDVLAQRWNVERVGTGSGRWDIGWEATDALARLDVVRAVEDPHDSKSIRLTAPVGLAVLAHSIGARFEAAAQTPSDTGTSATLIAWAIENGYDPSSQASLDAATKAFNALSYDERSRILGLPV